ncbi:hypothetical protein EIZ39_13620 [Ammoniphilus sp. CFH 90114]|nr:hypothetical protein EIZ39_13620 [Ammoniphilus sp. CFH 90114]
MRKTRPLLDDPMLSKYVPEIHWFSAERLKKMLHKHTTVYVKPDEGSLGMGVRRLELDDSKWKLTDRKSSKKLSPTKAIKTLIKKFNPNESYVVQQGIKFLTYKGRPFHIRVVMQKPMNRWQVSMMSAIIGNKKNALTTNVARGGDELPLEFIMHHKDQNWSPMNTYRELIDLSHQIAARLGSTLPLLVVGLDLAIDQRGRIWFIEANTRPDMSGMKELNDKISFKKYLRAKKWISRI